MKKLLFLLLLFTNTAFCQTEDHFTDGDFTSNPAWYGDSDLFVINEDFQLQLNDDAPGIAYLSTANTRIDSTQWEFWINLDFAPSSNNNARILLAAQEGNPENPGKAYFLQLGESGSEDAITLFKSTPQGDSLICRGTDGLINDDFSMAIKVTCDNQGHWEIYTDPLNSGLYQLEANGISHPGFQSAFFSLQCNYTVSNSEDFFFDDIVIKPLQVDDTPPSADSVKIVNNRELVGVFSEPLEESSAENADNYSITPTLGTPDSAVLDSSLPHRVHLHLPNALQDHVHYTLAIQNVEDLNGNPASDEELSFLYLEPRPPNAYEIVINEIMADVNPEPEQLPAYDYVELYNRTNDLIDLSGCTLKFGSRAVEFQEKTHIQPHSYLTITDNNSPLQVSPVTYFTSFPVNTEARMTLSTGHGKIIHSLYYKKEWYDDEEKEDGGWSMEIIDPENPCGCDENWSVTTNPAGGTPGQTNSIDGSNTDEVKPEISYINILNDSTLNVLFSEAMDSSTICLPEFYGLEDTRSQPQKVILAPPDYGAVRLIFESQTFMNESLYSLTISENAADCSGNGIATPSRHFANYEPVYGDLVIQEIMADVNPEPRDLPPVEYFEIYNRSNFPIDLTQTYIEAGNTTISFEEGRTIAPGDYLVVSERHQSLTGTKAIFLVSHLGLTNSGDQITLYKADGSVLFYTDYLPGWSDDETKAKGGWSLEMIDPENYCEGDRNWTASIDSDGGTPGEENSVLDENMDETSPSVKHLAAVNPHCIKLYFDEQIDSTTLMQTTSYQVEPSPGEITAVDPVAPSFTATELTFSKEIQPDVVYTLSVTNEVKDCMGNGLLMDESLSFSYPILADSNDLVINEILFNPTDDGVDFIELYNTSNHAIDVSSLYLSLLDPLTGETEKQVTLTDEKLIFVKNSYLVLTENANILLKKFPKAVGKNVLQVNDLPNFPNSSGRVRISDIQGQNLDELSYTEAMHFPLIDITDGVSLERVSPSKPSGDQDNWHSASETAGFATPGYENSQLSQNKANDVTISVSPNIVTPNNDGRNDQVKIAYNVDQPGFSANIVVYDAHGREVVRLCNNKPLGTSGALYWDGINADNKRVDTGHYIVYAELFDLKGRIRQIKKSVVIAGN